MMLPISNFMCLRKSTHHFYIYRQLLSQFHSQLSLKNASLLSRLYCTKTRTNELPNEKEIANLRLIRNIGIIAHIDAGKTTTTERMLFYSGYTPVMGEVHDGDTVMDYLAQERERGITITSASITFPWKNHRINLIDTPGHVDFTFEVERALSVLDGAVTILDASAGVEAQTITVWLQANRHNVPRIIYLNKMDKSNANVELCLKTLRVKLGVKPLMCHLPLFKRNNNKFYGVVDLINMEKIIWSEDVDIKHDGSEFEVTQLRDSQSNDNHLDSVQLYEKALQHREELIGLMTEMDDKLANAVISTDKLENISTQEINNALRRITINQLGFPILCGSSYKNTGVQLLLDAIIRYLPCPLEKTRELTKYYSHNELCAFAFKIIHHKRLGALTFLRIYSGQIKASQSIYNINRDKSEKISKLYVAYADDFKEVSVISNGNIAVVAGLNTTISGDTLVSSFSIADKVRKLYAQTHSISLDKSKPVLAGINVPEPVFFCSIEAPSMSKQKQLDLALENLQKEDPTFKVKNDDESGQVIIKGMGELHLEVIKDRILQEYNVEAYLGQLQISYREAITKRHEETIEFSKTVGGTKNYVKMTMVLKPKANAKSERKVKVVVTQENNLGNIREDYLRTIENGVEMALDHGPILSFPVIDVAIELLWLEVGRGTTYNMLSAATSQCITEIVKKASPILMEPYMKLQVSVPDSYSGQIISDLSNKRSQIEEMQSLGETRLLNTITPLVELVSYSTFLRSLTSGTGSFTMEFDSYQPMSEIEQKKAIKQVTGF